MSRSYGAPENALKKDERFGKIPAWIIKSRQFKDLGGVESKLLLWIAVKQDNFSHTIPSFSPSGLAEVLGFNRNRVSQAIKDLAVLGFVALKTKKRRFAVQLLFRDPNGVTVTEQQQPPILARLKDSDSPSKLSKKLWPREQEILAENARKDCGDLPAWITEELGPVLDDYEPGIDTVAVARGMNPDGQLVM